MSVMTRVVRLIQGAGRILSLLQLLFFLPLALEHNRETFLAFSASLAAFYFLLSTLRWVTQGSKMVYVVKAISMTQNIVIPMLLFSCARIYSPLPSQNALIEALRKSGKHASPWLQQPASLAKAFASSEVHAFLLSVLPSSYVDGEEEIVYPTWLGQSLVLIVGAGQYLLSQVPEWWYSLLLYLSPMFSLLEGLSSLLVIQSFALLSRWLINDSDRTKRGKWQGSAFMRKLLSFGLEPSEVWQLLFLLWSAVVYVLSAVALYMCFDSATDGRSMAAAAIGASLASTVWISAIAFAIRKANVVETSLMLSTSLKLGTDPLQMVRNFKASRIPKQVPLFIAQSTSAVLDRLVDAVEHSMYVLSAANEVLPTTIIVSLVYRLMVLYSAIRVLPRMNAHSAYDPHTDVLRQRRNQAWSERKLSEAQASTTPQVDARDADTRAATGRSDGKSAAASTPGAPHGTDTSAPASADAEAAEKPAAEACADTSAGKLETLLMSAKEPGSETEQDVAEYMQQAKPSRVDAVEKAVEHALERAEKVVQTKLEGEPRGSAVLKVLVTYSRFLLIAVYSHLLLLDQNHQIYWRLMTVFFTLGLWSVELLLSNEDSYLVSMYE
ncbi:hypothetical protein CBS14141_002021 [Malassezia furfur]|nr:hypothetical protein CBS14141_002021 [Malassezia furfur]